MSESWHLIPAFLRSPNISGDPDLYEMENHAADPDGMIEAAMRRIAPWDEKVVVDIGAGTGFHIERFHRAAAHVIGVEPEPSLRMKLMQRLGDRELSRTSVVGASAVSLPFRDKSVDIVHARFAYFFGPGCEPGIREVRRILRPVGTAFIIDNDLRCGTFASWIRTAYGVSLESITENERFWVDQGFTIERLASRWLFQDRETLERVVHLEFPETDATQILAHHPGLEIDYHLLLIHTTVGTELVRGKTSDTS